MINFVLLLHKPSARMGYSVIVVTLFACLSVCLSVSLSVCLSVYLSVYLFVCLSVCLSSKKADFYASKKDEVKLCDDLS